MKVFREGPNYLKKSTLQMFGYTCLDASLDISPFRVIVTGFSGGRGGG